MTLSRKSRKASRDRKTSESSEIPKIEPVGRETLINTTTEAQARMSIFARSMTPYIQALLVVTFFRKQWSEVLS